MFKYVICGIVIIKLAFCSPCIAAQAVSSAIHENSSGIESVGSSSSQQSQRKVLNIVVDKIEAGVIYSKDGEKYGITSATKVVDNSRKNGSLTTTNSSLRTAELFFENGSLVAVSLR